MPPTSNSTAPPFRPALVGLVGTLAGAWSGFLLHALAERSGGAGSPLPFLATLAPAGGSLAYLLDRLLEMAWRPWPGERRGWWSILPWAWSATGILFLLLPYPRFENAGSLLGLGKHLLGILWIGGVLLYAIPLLTPLIKNPDPRRSIGLLGALALLIAPCTGLNPPTESDEGDYVVAALAWSRTGSPLVAAMIEDSTLQNYYFQNLPVTWLTYKQQLAENRRDLARYSYRMPIYPWLLAPFVSAALFVKEPPVRWFLSYLPGIAFHALLAGLIAGLIARIDPNPRTRGWTLVAVTTATPFLYFTTNTQPEILMTACVTAAFMLGLDPRRRVASVIVAVLSCLVHERLLVVAGLIVLWQIAAGRGSRRRLAGVAFACFLPVLVAVWATMQFRFPERLPHAYGIPGLPFFDAARWMRASWMHLFSTRIGLLTHIPFFLVLPVAVWRAFFGGAARPSAPALVGAAIFAVYYAVLVTYPHTFDSWPHIRYLVPALPLLVPLLSWAVGTFHDTRSERAILAGLLILQAVRSWPFLAVPQLWRVIGYW